MRQRLNTMILMLALSICFVIFGAAQAAQAATYTVDTTADDAALTACTSAANDCSLRGAINNANALAGADTINFDQTVFASAQTITLSSSSPVQQLVINSDLTINGAGASLLTVKGYVNYGGVTIFEISGGAVAINNLNLTGGRGRNCVDYSTGAAVNTTCGGAIYMTGGTVTVSGSAFSGNSAGDGGAVYTRGGSLNISGSTISNNISSDRDTGGGIYTDGNSAVTITNSTVSGNIAGVGAGILVAGGTLSLANSTVSGNLAKNYTSTVTFQCPSFDYCYSPPPGVTCDLGAQTCTRTVSNNGIAGGILNRGGTVNVTNSTISGNIAQGSGNGSVGVGGGGIDNRSYLTVANSTITNNYGENGGGIVNRGSLNLSNSIVAGNRASSGADISNFPGATTSGNYNLVQNGDAVTGTGNITGVDAKLGVLANNGGPTQAHALLQGSPAIDAGDPNFNSANLPYDQRGAGFPRVVNGRVDIGAFEGYFYGINTLTDHDDGSCSASDCTLREAVKYAPNGTTINFGVTGTIILTGGEIAITKNLTITGPATAPGVTISGNNSSRIFYVNINNSGATFNFSNLTLTGGNGGGSGTNGAGGAVYIDATPSVVTITNSTISGNTASGNAGGIRGGNATLIITNSTISGNTASGATSNGGGLRLAGIVKIANSTISGNTAANGGGIYYSYANPSYTLTLTNSIVAGNTATTAAPDISNSSNGSNTVAGDYNLVQNTSGATLTGTHNITGQAASLGALADNGGATKTHALLVGSPAINAGDPNFDTSATPFDQRGTGFARKIGSAIDIGAFEVQPVAAPTDLTITKAHTGNFTQGDTGRNYTITVTNSGETASSGTVTATDSLPAGLTATAISGSGWNCTLGTLTCTRSEALASNSSYPAITLTVNVANNAPASVTNTATVSGGGETNTANNMASDPTMIDAAPTYLISGQVTNGGEGLSNVIVSLSGSATASTTTDASGNYSFANLNGGASLTVTPSLNGYSFVQPSITVNNLSGNQSNLNFATSVVSYEGDVAARPTGDGTVDILDIIAVGNIIAKLPGFAAPAAGGEFQRADAAPRATKGDGSIDVQDLIQMQLYAAALNPLTPASGATAAVPVPTSTISENPNGVDKADGDKSSRDVFGNQSNAPAAGAATVNAGTANASGGTAIIPIQLNSSNVGGVQFTVTYDAAKLSIPSLAAITNRAPNVSFTFNNSTPGQLGVVAFQSTAGDVFPASALLFNINFTVAGGAVAGSTSISFGNTPVLIKASDPAANAATITTTPGAVTILGPTAANVSISGRATTAMGRGIRNVLIRLMDAQGNVRIAYTTTFGYYRFAEVAAGETYIITAKGKRYEFSQSTQVINVNEDTVDINFTANP